MAYGARLESVLGETPQGFESPTLRAKRETPRKGRFLFSAKWLGDSRSRVAAGPLPCAKWQASSHYVTRSAGFD